MRIKLRPLPAEEWIYTDRNRPIGVGYRCQLCGSRVRKGYQEYMLQICDDCDREALGELFTFDWLPHTQRIDQRRDIQ